MTGQEIQDTIARAICASNHPCPDHVRRAADAMAGLVLAGHLPIGGGAGETPPAIRADQQDPAAQADKAHGTPAPPPRRFELLRHIDHSGITGTGVVAWGTQWPDGTASLRWGGPHPSTVAWANVERILAVHGHGGSTELRWLDGGT